MNAASLFSEIMDLLDDCVIIREPGGRVTGWNRAAEKVYGISREEALGEDICQLFAREADDLDRVKAEGVWSGTVERAPKGALKPILVSVTLRIQRDPDGTPAAVIETSRPLPAGLEDRQYEDLQRLLAAAGLMRVDIDATEVTRMLMSSAASSRPDLRDRLRGEPQLVAHMMQAATVVETALPQQEEFSETVRIFPLAGQRLSSFWPAESAECFVDTVLSVLVGGRQAQGTCLLLDAGGKSFEAEVTVVRASSAGDAVRLQLAIRDVSAEREAYRVLEASEHRYRNLFEYMPIGLTQIEASGLVDLFVDLRKQGVTDLSAYIDEHPGFMDQAMELLLVEQVNQTTADMFAAPSREDMKGPITRYWDPGIATLRRSLVARYDGQDFFQEEVKMRRMDGGTIDVLYATSRHSSLPNKSLVAFVDVSHRKRAEQALRLSERRYQDLFQAMTVSFWELDLAAIGTLLDNVGAETPGDLAGYLEANPSYAAKVLQASLIVDVNDQTTMLFGGSDKAELLGSLDRFWSPSRRDEGAAAVLTAMKNGGSLTIETLLRRLDGSEFDAQFTLWFSTDDQTRGLAAVTDISERVNAFTQLEQSEQRYRDLFQHVPVPVMQVNSVGLLTLLEGLKERGVVDLASYMDEHPDLLWTAMEHTIIEEVNDAALKVLGAKDPRDVRGPITPLWRNYPENYARLLQTRYEAVSTFEEEVRVTTFDGREREGLLTVTFPPALAKSGVTINAFVDTTEKKQADRRLRQIEAEFAHAARISMLGELTASIAHEVNQPLAAITTYGEAGLRWLSRPTPEISEVRDIVTRIVADAQRAASVIARVRNMASQRPQEKENLSLDELVAEAVLFLKHEFQANAIKATYRPSTAGARVLCDRIQVQQVIVNLAVNAIQAISGADTEKREILLRISDEDDCVRCSVEDSGPGISGEGANRVFESFFTTKSDGMGMGLPISRSIIEAHGGRMFADNDSALGGARFSFILPVAR